MATHIRMAACFTAACLLIAVSRSICTQFLSVPSHDFITEMVMGGTIVTTYDIFKWWVRLLRRDRRNR